MKLFKFNKKINLIEFLNLYFIGIFFFLFLILFYIFGKYNKLSYFYIYYPYFFLILLLLILIFIFFTLINNHKIIFFLIFNSFFFSLYFVELTIYLFYKNNFNKIDLESQRIKLASELGVFFDTRKKMDFYIDFKEINKNSQVSLAISTNNFFNTNQELFPLAGGISNNLLIHCNENGNYTYYESDKFGFNNSDYVWDSPRIDFLLVGDSFTQGACVNTNENEGFANIFKHYTGKNVLNLGVGGSGLLTYYARIKEYVSDKKINNLIIFLYEGDLHLDLIKELKDYRLRKYLDINYSQDLINNQKYSDLVINNFIDTQLNFKITNIEIKSSYNFLSFVKLQKLRSFMRLFFPQYDKKKSKFISKNLLKNIRILQPNTRLFIVCLPSIERYHAHSAFMPKYIFNDECSDISFLAKEFNYTIIDVHEELFKFHKNPKSLYPFGIHGHYNSQGYEMISKFLIKKYFSE
jgi:hypothetical protein